MEELVAKKERLIELLEEKRAALINQAVTRGLDPDVPMKDSGVPWIGEIPEHWDIVKLRHLGRITNGTTPSRDEPSYWSEGTIPWIASGEINQGVIVEPTECITEEALSECALTLVPKGSVLVGMVGQGKTRGMSARLSIEGTINQNLAAILPFRRIDPVYLHGVLETAYEPLRNSGQGANQSALNCEVIGGFSVPLPPKPEQEAISMALRVAKDRLSVLRERLVSQVRVVQEYRQSLITMTVTGQFNLTRHASRKPNSLP